MANPQNQSLAIIHIQLAMKSLDMRVNRAWRDPQVVGDYRFRFIIECGSDDLEFATGEVETAGDFAPGEIREHRAARRDTTRKGE